MLRGKEFVNSKGYSSRHLSANDYYEKGHRVEGRWIGQACERYGVDQGEIVDDNKFERLKDNKHAITGEQVTVRQNTTREGEDWVVGKDGKLKKEEVPNRRQFYDFTIGVPKTFSIAAITGADSRVRLWHDRAVEKVIAQMEALTARQVHSRKEARVEITGKFVAATYKHTANRCLEPHVHDHIVIFNMTPGANGKNYAVEARQWMDNSRYLTSIYWDALAAQARAAGIEVVIDEHGAPQIKSLIDLIEVFSRRTSEIEMLVETFEERVGIKLSNRERKTIVFASRGFSAPEFERLWELNKESFVKLNDLQSSPEDTAKLRREQLNRFKALVRSRRVYDGKLTETTTEEVLATQRSLLNPKQLERVLSFKSEREQAISLPAPISLEEAIEFAVDHCFARNSVVKDFDLHQEIIDAAQGSGVDIQAMKDLLAKHPKLIFSRGEYTTTTHLARELEMIQWAKEGNGKGVSIGVQDLDKSLSQSQAKAVRKLLESPDQFSALVGKAGVGKTTCLRFLVTENIRAGRKVFVCAPDNGARDVLRKECESLPTGQTAEVFKRAENMHLFLADPRLRNSLMPGGLLIIDEAGKASVEKMHELMGLARDRQLRLLIVGDPRQHSSVDAGDAMAVLIRLSGVLKARLTEIVRQKPDVLKGHYLKAAKLFSDGKTTQAFAELDQAGVIIEHKGRGRIEALAEAILRDQAAGLSVIAVNPSHRENDAVADAVRSRLKETGELTEERIIKAHRSLGWTHAERRRIDRIKIGHILEITRGRDKGRTWRVTGVEGGKIIATDENGEARVFTRGNAKVFDVCEERNLEVSVGDRLITYAGQRTKNGEIINGERVTVTGWGVNGEIIGEKGKVISVRNLSHAYASTSHKCQGDTSDKVILGLDRHSIQWADQKLAYVAGTRGKIAIEVLVESKAELTGIQSRSGERKAATQMDFNGATRPPDVQRLVHQLEQIKAANQARQMEGVQR